MKAKKLTAIILALALCVSMMCTFASAFEPWKIPTWEYDPSITQEERNAWIRDKNLEWLNENVFTSGSFGSAESTGKLGAVYVTDGYDIGEDVWDSGSLRPGDWNGRCKSLDEGVSDNITWTLKNGVLTLSGSEPRQKLAQASVPSMTTPISKPLLSTKISPNLPPTSTTSPT